MIISLVAIHGAQNWSAIARHLKGRLGKQCRERYSSIRILISQGPYFWFVYC